MAEGKKITELTPENQAAIPVYVDKWVGIGLNTDRLDYDKTLDIVNDFQEHILNRERTPVIIMDNPVEAWVACNYAVEGVALKDIPARVKSYFAGNKDIEIASPVYPYQDGSFFASIFAFYDYMLNELKVDIDEDLKRKYYIWQKTSELGLIYPLDNVCIVTQKPTAINVNEEGRIHCDGGPAVAYAGDGDFNIYALNGVRVSKYLAETPSNKLDIQHFHSITNADERTEFVRKFGVERMIDLGKKIDSYEKYNEEWWTKSQYELWDMATIFEGVAYAPHLKMMNQTTGVWHVEAVAPTCRTLKQAISDRFGGREFEIISIA